MREFFSTLDVSGICGVDPVTVARWCDRGDLACYKTPGGHRRIRREDLVGFLRKHGMQVPPEIERSGVRVLAVVGDPRLLATLRRRYVDHGGRIDLITAANGIAGLIRFGASTPEVVVLDLEAAGVDALAVCRQLRDADPARPVKVIALSPGADPGTCRRALQAGATACLPKPFDMKALDSLILPSVAFSSRKS